MKASAVAAKIRQLVSNGLEWLGHENPKDDSKRILLSPPPGDQDQAIFVGQGYSDPFVMNFAEMQKIATAAITEVAEVEAGFRVVFSPARHGDARFGAAVVAGGWSLEFGLD